MKECHIYLFRLGLYLWSLFLLLMKRYVQVFLILIRSNNHFKIKRCKFTKRLVHAFVFIDCTCLGCFEQIVWWYFVIIDDANGRTPKTKSVYCVCNNCYKRRVKLLVDPVAGLKIVFVLFISRCIAYTITVICFVKVVMGLLEGSFEEPIEIWTSL